MVNGGALHFCLPPPSPLLFVAFEAVFVLLLLLFAEAFELFLLALLFEITGVAVEAALADLLATAAAAAGFWAAICAAVFLPATFSGLALDDLTTKLARRTEAAVLVTAAAGFGDEDNDLSSVAGCTDAEEEEGNG